MHLYLMRLHWVFFIKQSLLSVTYYCRWKMNLFRLKNYETVGVRYFITITSQNIDGYCFLFNRMNGLGSLSRCKLRCSSRNLYGLKYVAASSVLHFILIKKVYPFVHLSLTPYLFLWFFFICIPNYQNICFFFFRVQLGHVWCLIPTLFCEPQ